MPRVVCFLKMADSFSSAAAIFCATDVAGKPRVFYCTRTDAEGKGPGLMLWEGAGKARVIGYFPEE